MRGIKKFRTFQEARIDLYREMWERGFDKDRLSRLLEETKNFLDQKGINQGQLYPPGIYPFRTLALAEEDLHKRIEKRRNHQGK
ncbi:MAG: hypothetical protein NT056_11335 [Proteobacteria bacterium]|nr:hypothetical protein [Pseudomonadota bacterium]